MGLQKAIEERLRFARARKGTYEVIDFMVMLIGYAVSGKRTLPAFWERLLPFATSFMALFGRSHQPHPATLSRFLAALDRASVEALRALFEEYLVARSAFGSPPDGISLANPGKKGDQAMYARHRRWTGEQAISPGFNSPGDSSY